MLTGHIVDSYTNIATEKRFAHNNSESQYAKQGMQSFLDTFYRQMRGVSVSLQIANYSNIQFLN